MSNAKNFWNWSMHRAVACVAALIGLMAAAALAAAFTSPGGLVAACTVRTAPALNFGGHASPDSDVDETTLIQVRCAKTAPYSIALDTGTGSGAAVAARKLTGGGADVNYALYSDRAHMAAWADTIGPDTLVATGTGTPAAGTDTDAITVTITY
jgi:spore coat protein U-like protein